ncbi:MAG: GDP-mannose 4,6-dehydratase [Actinobacteria bacterium]|nr:GDP-mannose 4,6-dehydratase [Actinomycetota bacterium]
MKTVVVTGGAGFIGSHLVKKLLIKGYFVVNIDNFDKFYPKKFKLENIAEVKNNKNHKFYYLDINKQNELKKILKNYSPIDSLVHLAARAGVRPSIEKPSLYEKINVGGTYKLLNTIPQLKIRQLVFASSSSVYGNCQTPFSEKEKCLKPLSPYGQTKLKAEKLCFDFYKKTVIPTTILRFFSVYGPYGRPDMAPYLFTKAIFKNLKIKQYGDGSSARDWTYIDDIVGGIMKAIEKRFRFEIINLGGNEPIKLIDLIKTIEIITQKKIRKVIQSKQTEEPDITFANIDKAKRLLGWQPKISHEEGMKRFIQWYVSKRLKNKVARP